MSDRAMDSKIESMHMDTGSQEQSSKEDGQYTFAAIDPAEEKHVVRKLDTHVLPLMIFVYFCMCKFANSTLETETRLPRHQWLTINAIYRPR